MRELIEIAVNIFKSRYYPPVAAFHEEKIKTDIIVFFATVIGDVIETLNSDGGDAEKIKRIRGLIKERGLKL